MTWTLALLLALLSGAAAGDQAPPHDAAPPPETTPETRSEAPALEAGKAPQEAPSAAPAPAPRDALLALADGWFETVLATYPFFATEIGDPRFHHRFDFSIDPKVRQRLGEAARSRREELGKIDRQALGGEDRLTYDLLQRELESTLEGLAFPDHLLPVSYLTESVPVALAHMASPSGVQPFRSVEDYDDFLARMAAFPAWVEVAVANLRRGMAAGVVQPRSVAEAALGRLEALAVEDPRQSPLYRPVRELPRSFPRDQRRRIEDEYRRVIGREVLPAYRYLRDFVRGEYLPRCRESISWSALPGGEDWYRHLVRRETTTGLAPAEILALGQREVERIVGELSQAADDLGHGDLATLFNHLRSRDRFFLQDREAVLREYGAIRRRVEEALPRLFLQIPSAPFQIHGVRREESAYLSGEMYLPPGPDGSRPGVFYVTARTPYQRTGMEALFLHEALPGHHFQIALARELEELPRFRRFGHSVAYVEGWALYAESLGRELGLYQDPYQDVGRLSSNLLRAARLVLDTGIHQGGWSAREAAEMARRHTLGAGRQEIVRYAAMPAQALAYKVGEQRILELRREAEEALGEGFDPRAFHHQVLRHGPLPLDLLEREVRRWLAAQRPEPPPSP